MKCYDLRVRLPRFITALFSNAVWRMQENERVVYLTFDDGPVPGITPWVLGLLEKENIKATFFCVGENVMKYPEVYQLIQKAGHSVGNHTFNHLQGIKQLDQHYFENINLAGSYIDSNLFRPPHGLMKPSQYNYLKTRYRIIMWDLISCDYDRSLKPERVYRNVVDFVRPGSIVTFHDSEKAKINIMEVLPKAILWMKEQGYRFEAIPNKQD
ncbi:MAG: polysaccharide deacetylase family protein [Methylococcaceae bacterium]|nr:polysaccharide deacetylase family protein [Prolixibacteraceae bacterium]